VNIDDFINSRNYKDFVIFMIFHKIPKLHLFTSDLLLCLVHESQKIYHLIGEYGYSKKMHTFNCFTQYCSYISSQSQTIDYFVKAFREQPVKGLKFIDYNRERSYLFSDIVANSFRPIVGRRGNRCINGAVELLTIQSLTEFDVCK